VCERETCHRHVCERLSLSLSLSLLSRSLALSLSLSRSLSLSLSSSLSLSLSSSLSLSLSFARESVSHRHLTDMFVRVLQLALFAESFAGSNPARIDPAK